MSPCWTKPLDLACDPRLDSRHARTHTHRHTHTRHSLEDMHARTRARTHTYTVALKPLSREVQTLRAQLVSAKSTQGRLCLCDACEEGGGGE